MTAGKSVAGGKATFPALLDTGPYTVEKKSVLNLVALGKVKQIQATFPAM